MHALHLLGEKGPARFGGIRRLATGISPKMLTRRLRGPEADGLVRRAHEPSIPPEVTHGLTEMGLDIRTALKSLDVRAKRCFTAA
jgi:DNA-binding HxlR family transcriptional regulator